MTIKFYNNASTTVSGGITALDTTVALAANSGTLFQPGPTGGDYFVATFYDQQTKTINEIVHVTAISGDVATIVRAQEGTTAKAWGAGDIFANLITAGTLNAFVQAGTGPANTSLIYVGTDVGTINHIVATTNPVPAALAIGMCFVIKVAHANTGATDMALNGLPAYAVKYTDGADFTRADVVGSMDYLFIWNGTNFSSTIMHSPKIAPTLFYVRSDSTSIVNMTTGLESNTGLANTPQDAFKTIQGAINTIQATYISTISVKIMVSDGSYIGAGFHSSQYISAFEIQGNDANPANCLIDCTSTNLANYVPGAGPAGFGAGKFGNLTVHGFSIKSYGACIGCDTGVMHVSNCNFQSPTSGHSSVVEVALGGSVGITGNIHLSLPVGGQAVFDVAQSGLIGLGGRDDFTQIVLNLYLDGPCYGYFLEANTGGIISVANDTGPSGNTINLYGSWPFQGYEYAVGSAGGVGFLVGTTYFPSTQAGYILAPGWVT